MRRYSYETVTDLKPEQLYRAITDVAAWPQWDIDGAADDETTLRRNTASFERCDLVPNVLRGVGRRRHVGDRDGPEAGAAGLLLAHRAAAAVPSPRRARGGRGGARSSARCSASPRSAPSAWRRCARRTPRRRSISSISTRTAA